MTWRIALVVGVLLTCASSAHGQFDSANISGAVQDTTGAILPGVDVTLTNVGTKIARQTVTNEAGLYTFPNVPVGEYQITAALSGFKSITKSGVQVNAGLNIRVDVALEVGALSETIQVEAATTLVDTSVIGRTVRAEQIAETPLSGRRASQVAQLAPGVVGGNMGGSVPTGVGTFATGVTSINGGRADEFMTTIDGAPSIRVRAAGGFMMGAQNFDTVAEVQVLTTNYQAEYGRSSAGQLRLVTKSGTQSFRGNVFWSHQNDALDANSWTRKTAGLEKSPHTYNAYGFTLGGPIYIPGAFNSSKQNLFFFWGQEWQRDRTVEEQTGIVPTAAMRNGDFSSVAGPVRDPRTGLDFPNKIIPQDRISPQGRALLNAFPLPIPGFQQGANNWIGNPSVFNNQRKDSIKIDWVPSSNHRLAVRHTWAPNVWNDPEPLMVYSTIWDYPGRTMAATLTSTLSNSLINEFSFSWGSTSPSKYFGQRNCDYCPGGTGAFLYPTTQSAGINYPYLFPGTKLDADKIPNVSVQGFTAINNAAYPGAWNDFVFLWADNVTKVTGNHVFKAGVSIERSGMNDQIQLSFAQVPATTNQNGSFRFFNATRPDSRQNAAANAMLGLFDDYTEFGNKPNTKWVAMAYDFYAQDNWKPTRALTLELGLRYSLWQPWGVSNGAMASFQPAFYNPATAPVIDRSLTGGFVVSGDRFNGVTLPGDEPTDDALAEFPQLAGLQRLYHGVPNGFAETAKDGFQPRLGMAYALNELTTFRAGVGRFLNRVQINTTAAYGFNAPLSEMQTVINGSVDAPGGASTRNFPLVGASQSPDFTNPTSWAWNATVDRVLPWQMRGALSYVGRSASHLERARNINQLQAGTIQANPGVNTNALRPYLGFGSITLYETTGTSKYNSLQIQVERRGTRGVGFSVAYTFSQTKDNGSGRGDILPNAYDDSGYYGISDLDRPHVFVSQARYRFPTLDGSVAPLRWVLGNWDVSGIFQAQSGAPFDVRSNVDRAGVGAGSGNQFYDQLSSDPLAARRTEWGPLPNRPSLGAIWFDPAAFGPAALGTFATTQEKNSLRQPGFWDVNLSFRKGFNMIGTQRFDLRIEAFNIFNRTRLGNAVTNPTLPDFGFITSRVGSRTMQIGMQYIF